MRIKRKFDEVVSADSNFDDKNNGASSHEDDDDDDDDGREFEDYEDEEDRHDVENEEDLNHVRNLGNELQENQRQIPPAKRSKFEVSGCVEGSGDNRVLKLLQENSVQSNSKAVHLYTKPGWIGNRSLTLLNQSQQSLRLSEKLDCPLNSKDPNCFNRSFVRNGADSMLSCDPTHQSSYPADSTAFSVVTPQAAVGGWLSPAIGERTFSCPRKRSLRRVPTSSESNGYDPSKPSHLVNLPDEVIIRIFAFLTKTSLSRCAVTCKKLSRISCDETLWRRVDLGGKCLPPGVVGQVLSRGAVALRLARASVAAPIFENKYGLKFSSFSKSKLQYLDLSMVTIQPLCLELLISSCVQLKKLSLENCHMTDLSCKMLAEKNGKTLEVLHMGMVEGLTDTSINDIVSHCQKLTELNLAWTKLRESAWDEISTKFTPNLRKLNISGHRDTLLTHHLEDIVRACPHLTELDISDCSRLSSPSVETIIEGLPELEMLSASRCYEIQPSTFLNLKSSSSLKFFNVFGSIKDSAIEDLRRHLPNIEINKFLFSSIARPTVGIKRTSIWNLRVRDYPSN